MDLKIIWEMLICFSLLAYSTIMQIGIFTRGITPSLNKWFIYLEITIFLRSICERDYNKEEKILKLQKKLRLSVKLLN